MSKFVRKLAFFFERKAIRSTYFDGSIVIYSLNISFPWTNVLFSHNSKKKGLPSEPKQRTVFLAGENTKSETPSPR